jgi:hypothetical protein
VSVRVKRNGIRLLGGVTALIALPLLAIGIGGAWHPGGHDVGFLAAVGILLLAAGIAAANGSRVAAAAISVMSALFGAGMVFLWLHTPPVGIRVIAGNMVFIALLLIPALVTIRDWKGGYRP